MNLLRGLVMLAVFGGMLALLLPPVLLKALKMSVRPGPEQQRWSPRPALNNVEGFPLTPWITSERIASLTTGKLKSLGAGEDSVWVTTYAKSGTTWTQKIVNTLNGHPDDTGIFKGCPWPEVALGSIYVAEDDLNKLQPLPGGKMCWKSHWTRANHMADPTKRVIYVMRNVMDVAVSHYHHTYSMKFLYDYDGTFDEFFELFAKGDVDNGNWFDHVASWWPHRNDSNVLLLRYEDMTSDPATAVKQIADFMGLEATPDRIAEVVQKSSFKVMKAQENADVERNVITALGGLRGPHIREGKVGGSKTVLSVAQRQVLKDMYEARLQPLGVPVEWCLLPMH